MARTILFLCPHNAAKSVIAAARCAREAARRGLGLRVDSAGTEPDPAPAQVVVARLADEGIDVSAHRPRRVEAGDLSAASRVVSIGCDVSDLAPAGTPIECWDEVPAPSAELDRALPLIAERVGALVEEEAASAG